jgi:hypothetical protein
MSKMLKSRNMSGSLREEREYRVVNAQNIVITMYLSAIQCAMYKGRNYIRNKVILWWACVAHDSAMLMFQVCLCNALILSYISQLDVSIYLDTFTYAHPESRGYR